MRISYTFWKPCIETPQALANAINPLLEVERHGKGSIIGNRVLEAAAFLAYVKLRSDTARQSLAVTEKRATN
jgi:hypothetical protein